MAVVRLRRKSGDLISEEGIAAAGNITVPTTAPTASTATATATTATATATVASPLNAPRCDWLSVPHVETSEQHLI